MFGDGTLTFREFTMNEPIPLATIHDAVLEFLRGRDDVAVFGAQAVNAYVDHARMTQDIDILSTRAADLAEELRSYLHDRFKIAVRCRTVADGNSHRIYQARKPSNRHLVELRSVADLPGCQQIGGIQVLTVEELIAHKVISMVGRKGSPKAMTDRADLLRLLLAFPDLKSVPGPVSALLRKKQASESTLAAWQDLVAEEITMDDDDSGY